MKRYLIDIVKLYQPVWPPHPLDFGVDPSQADGPAEPVFMTTEDTHNRIMWVQKTLYDGEIHQGTMYRVGPPERSGWYWTQLRTGHGAWLEPEPQFWHVRDGMVWYSNRPRSERPEADAHTSSDLSGSSAVRVAGPIQAPKVNE